VNQPSADDVARGAGVSRTQVSYVMNNTRAAHVSAENRQKILEAAEALGYQPHQSAQALARGYANEFALFFPAPYTFRINAMLGSIHEWGLADGCVPVQYSFNSYLEPVRKRAALRTLLARKPRGLFCSPFDVSAEDLDEARSRGVRHIVLWDLEDHADYPTLVLPVGALGALAVNHLAAQGHRNIGFLRPADPVQGKAYAQRLAGAQRATEALAGVGLIELPWPDESRPTFGSAGVFLDRSELSSRGITALYCYSDEYALPLLAALHDRGVIVPRDLAVMGTDDLEFGALVRPALTTISC
jgi:DNA-binding LacI/PurR family transcriptional regulator